MTATATARKVLFVGDQGCSSKAGCDRDFYAELPEGPYKGRPFCHTHYERARRNGNPDKPIRERGRDLEQLPGLRILKETKEALEREAKRRGCSLSDVVREALEKAAKRWE